MTHPVSTAKSLSLAGSTAHPAHCPVYITHCTCTCKCLWIWTCTLHTKYWTLYTAHHMFIVHFALFPSCLIDWTTVFCIARARAANNLKIGRADLCKSKEKSTLFTWKCMQRNWNLVINIEIQFVYLQIANFERIITNLVKPGWGVHFIK